MLWLLNRQLTITTGGTNDSQLTVTESTNNNLNDSDDLCINEPNTVLGSEMDVY